MTLIISISILALLAMVVVPLVRFAWVLHEIEEEEKANEEEWLEYCEVRCIKPWE